jgi:hypothetical protein
MLVAGVLTSCTASHEEAASPATPAVTAAPAAPAPAAEAKPRDPGLALPDVQRARIEFGLASFERFAQDWPWIRVERTCVLLISPTVQWIANCDEPPTYDQVEEPLRGRPVYSNRSTTLDAGGQEVPVTIFMQAVPAMASIAMPEVEANEAGEKPPWIIATTLEALREHHPAFKQEANTEEWLGIFLHEFFHTQQELQPSFRVTLAALDAKELDPTKLDQAYATDPAYRAQVEREYKLLSEAAARDDALTPEAARAVLADWQKLYDERTASLLRLGGEALARVDVVELYLEGTARYAESLFIAEPRLRATLAIPGDPYFTSFAGRGRKYAQLSNRKLGTKYYYSLGYHLGLVLDRVDPSWKARVSDTPDWIVGIAREQAKSAGKKLSASVK